MKIQRATFLGVRGVPDATLELTGPKSSAPASTVVVAGPSGSGKTRLLEALVVAKEAIGAYGPMARGAPWIGGGAAAKILVTFHLDEAERDYAGTASPTVEGEVIFLPDRIRSEAPEGLRAVLERYSHDPAHGKLEYFPATRRLLPHPPFTGLGVAEQRIARPGKDARKYSFVVPFLLSLQHDARRAERFASRLAALCPAVAYAPDPEGAPIPRCFRSRGGPPATPFELSSGETDAVVFAATATAIGLERSLVLVDRPDLHLDDVERLAAGLAALGQDNQLFLAASAASTGLADRLAAAAGAHLVTLKEP
jgi:hypothetical protein